MQDEQGTQRRRPHPFLRCTRVLQRWHGVDHRAGVYFIDSLPCRGAVAWCLSSTSLDRIDALKPHGGIRIEDNIVIHESASENMTRSELGLMRPYPIPAEATCFTEEIKKSCFITCWRRPA